MTAKNDKYEVECLAHRPQHPAADERLISPIKEAPPLDLIIMTRDGQGGNLRSGEIMERK